MPITLEPSESSGESWFQPEVPIAGPTPSHWSLLGKVKGEIHDAPLVEDLRSHCERAGVRMPANFEHGEDAAPLAIQMSFHVETQGFAYVNGVGLEMRFRDDEAGLNRKTACRVLGYLPQAREEQVAGADVSGTLEFGFGDVASQSKRGFYCKSVRRPKDWKPTAEIGNMKVGASGKLGASLLLSVTWKRTIVEAWGSNHWSVRWLFRKDEESIINREFNPWCILLSDRHFDALTFDARILFETWSGIVPELTKSKWQRFEVPIEGRS